MQLSSELAGVSGELHPRCTWSEARQPLQSPWDLAPNLGVLPKGRNVRPWFINVKYKLSLIVLVSMAQV